MGIVIEKHSNFRNSKEIKPTGDVIPEGYKRVWIPKHKLWVEVKTEESNEDAIKRITAKFDNKVNFEDQQLKFKNDGESKT